MVLVFKQVTLQGLMELNGTIDFPQGKAVVLYGSNQQGKTNVINAIRFAFLRESKGLGRPKKEYDEWGLPSREELVFDGDATIKVLFEHDNVLYSLERLISGGGRREAPELYRVDAPSEKLDIPDFLNNRLKVSLLDALFAPEIVGGFKQLYSGSIDESIAEMFKEITTLRSLCTSFINRFQRMRRSAEMQVKLIESKYGELCTQISETAPMVSEWKEVQDLQKFEPGKVVKKLDTFLSRLQSVRTKLKEEELLAEIQTLRSKAKESDSIMRSLEQEPKIQERLSRLKDFKTDWRSLKRWVDSASRIKDVKTTLREPPEFMDARLRANIDGIISSFKEAKQCYVQATELARKEKVKLEAIPESISELNKVLRILRKRIRIGNESPATITKVGGKVYTVLDMDLLARDPSLTDISKHPIPKGTANARSQYLRAMTARVNGLKAIQSLHKRSESLFSDFVSKGLRDLHGLVENLDKKIRGIEQQLQNWSDNLAVATSSITGRKVKAKKIRRSSDVERFVQRISVLVSQSKKKYLTRLNRIVRGLNISVAHFEGEQLEMVERQVRKHVKALPQFEKIEKLVSEVKPQWQGNVEIYKDYAQIPALAGTIVSLLEKVLGKCFDETKLREWITATYTDIISLMHERRLIQAVAQVSPQQIRAVVRYKGRQISHPAGSEKAFFSLAILTALAHYFRTPVLIDEVANNLDSRNLKAFFDLIVEFKKKYGVQYVLSVKETKDFDLDTWVRELRDDIALYEVREKSIQMVPL